MTDVAELVRDELEQLAPPGEANPMGWDDVLRRAAPRAARAPHRLRLVVAAVAMLVAVVVPAFAFSASVRTLFGFDRPVFPITAEATHVISAPVGNGFYAHMWHSPSTTGGRCTFQTLDHAPTPTSKPARSGAGSCGGPNPDGLRDRARADHPLRVGVSIGRRPVKRVPATWVPPVVNGSVYEGLGATRVQVEWRGGRLPLVLQDGYFLGGGPQLYMPPFARFPFSVVAYDAEGREVARKRLESPGLRLTKGGWKQYAREYLAWKAAHR